MADIILTFDHQFVIGNPFSSCVNMAVRHRYIATALLQKAEESGQL